MARKQEGPGENDQSQYKSPPREERYAVPLEPALKRHIAIIAAACNKTIPEWVDEVLRPAVQRELPRVLAEAGIKVVVEE